MTAQVQFVASSSGITAVPAESIRNDSGSHYIFVPKNKRLERREVRMMGSRQGLVKVKGDIKQGDLVVISPSRNLKAGQLVQF